MISRPRRQRWKQQTRDKYSCTYIYKEQWVRVVAALAVVRTYVSPSNALVASNRVQKRGG